MSSTAVASETSREDGREIQDSSSSRRKLTSSDADCSASERLNLLDRLVDALLIERDVVDGHVVCKRGQRRAKRPSQRYSQPSRASRKAIALPIPRAAPVTSATLPLMRPLMGVVILIAEGSVVVVEERVRASARWRGRAAPGVGLPSPLACLYLPRS